jgi:spermidine synthase
MKPQTSLGRVTTPDGNTLLLYVRDGVYSIRVNGLELMSSRAHGSEEALARLGCTFLGKKKEPRVLVAGLGMGYTLRAALDCLPGDARVMVSEYFSAVVDWCRGPLAPLAGNPLDDPRVSVRQGDVASLVSRQSGFFDAVLLDVDNGPSALTVSSNARLYSETGVAMFYRALRPGGVLALWSADHPEKAFCRRLRKTGFDVRTETVLVRPGAKGPRHTILLAQR